MFCTMLVFVLHAKHLPMKTGNAKLLVRLQAWLIIIPAYSIPSCFYTDGVKQSKSMKLIRFLSLDKIFACSY